MTYVDLAPPREPRPDLVLRCTECAADVGVHGDVADLDPHTYVCCDCLVANHQVDDDPEPRVILRSVA